MRKRIVTILIIMLCTLWSQYDFTPSVTIQLDPNYELVSSEFTVLIGQDNGEIDILQFAVAPDQGYWDFTGVEAGQQIGSGTATFFDGLCDEEFAMGDGEYGPEYACNENNDTEVLVSIIVNQVNAESIFLVATISASSNSEYPVGVTPAGIILSNTVDGPLMEVAYLQPDIGDTTQGHLSTMTIDSLFTNPEAGDLTVETLVIPETADDPPEDFIVTQIIEIISPIFGCTDPAAINYNPEANVDDGSCVAGVMGDLDQNEDINILDIVLMVAIVIGNIVPTEYQWAVGDLTGDSLINILDIVSLVAIIIAV